MYMRSLEDDDLQLDAVLELASSQSGSLGQRVKEALDVIANALATHGEEHVVISFNGGKDCTVLLHLYAAALRFRRLRCNNNHDHTRASSSVSPSPIPAIYIAPPSPFLQLEAFINASEQRYNLALFRVAGADGMKSALEVYKRARPEVRSILVGTRRGDPHGEKLGMMTPTDQDWPRFERVHPVLHWSYADIWAFLRRLNVPYCTLYDAGYTSLGSTYNTFRNPALRKDCVDGEDTYHSAYELEDETLERAGRSRTTAPPLAGVSPSEDESVAASVHEKPWLNPDIINLEK